MPAVTFINADIYTLFWVRYQQIGEPLFIAKIGAFCYNLEGCPHFNSHYYEILLFFSYVAAGQYRPHSNVNRPLADEITIECDRCISDIAFPVILAIPHNTYCKSLLHRNQ